MLTRLKSVTGIWWKKEKKLPDLLLQPSVVLWDEMGGDGSRRLGAWPTAKASLRILLQTGFWTNKGQYWAQLFAWKTPPPPNPDEIYHVILDIASLRVITPFPIKIHYWWYIPLQSNKLPSLPKNSHHCQKCSRSCLNCLRVSDLNCTRVRPEGKFTKMLTWHVGMEPRTKSQRCSRCSKLHLYHCALMWRSPR